MIRFRRGTALLNKVVKQFDQAVADLAVAQEQIENQRIATLTAVRTKTAKNVAREQKLRELTSRIQSWFANRNSTAEDQLYKREQKLYAAYQRAGIVRDNIAKLVGAA